jgi:tetratricopeptide (TPR) repeat protein
LDAALQAGAEANKKRRFDESFARYKEAVSLADQLQPHDYRLAVALDHLGACLLGRDFPAADAAYERELKVYVELMGPETYHRATPLTSLGNSAMVQHNYERARDFYTQAVQVNEKAFGESSTQVAESLLYLAQVYAVQKKYDVAEPFILRSLRTEESLLGGDRIDLMPPLWSLCNLYSSWEKPDKAEPCYERALGILEKQYGASSPVLVSVLAGEAKALRDLGRTDQAAQVEKRTESIRAAMTNPN